LKLNYHELRDPKRVFLLEGLDTRFVLYDFYYLLLVIAVKGVDLHEIVESGQNQLVGEVEAKFVPQFFVDKFELVRIYYLRVDSLPEVPVVL